MVMGNMAKWCMVMRIAKDAGGDYDAVMDGGWDYGGERIVME